jgi:hypothetical protein
MKKVPHWIQKVIFASQKVWCADARNDLLDRMISGNFNYPEFQEWCKNTHNIQIDGNLETAHNYWEAIELCDKDFKPISIQRLINDAGL